LTVTIRTFQPGDEAVQVAIYNEAAAALPRFKPATVPEVQRRTRARDFDSAMRFFAVEGGRPVAYSVFNPNGRVSYPWCCAGHEALAEQLFNHVLEAMRQRGMKQAFAAYRGDWTAVNDFFLKNGFSRARDMVNFVVDVIELPTAPARRSSAITPLEKRDVPGVLALAPEVLRVRTAAELERHLFANPYFPPEALFALRSRTGDSVTALGVLVTEPTYADPKAVDAAMPCFRLGAFGTEGMQTKRIKGLFSFLARADHNLPALGLDLIGHAALRLGDDDDIASLAAQVPSDAPHLLRFYEKNFRRQGSFPVFERDLGGA
jgi:hypothetical protein